MGKTGGNDVLEKGFMFVLHLTLILSPLGSSAMGLEQLALTNWLFILRTQFKPGSLCLKDSLDAASVALGLAALLAQLAARGPAGCGAEVACCTGAVPALGKAKQGTTPRVVLHPFCMPQAGSQSPRDAGLAILPPLPGSRDSVPAMAGLWGSLDLTLILGYGGDSEQHRNLQTEACLQHVDPCMGRPSSRSTRRNPACFLDACLGLSIFSPS